MAKKLIVFPEISFEDFDQFFKGLVKSNHWIKLHEILRKDQYLYSLSNGGVSFCQFLLFPSFFYDFKPPHNNNTVFGFPPSLKTYANETPNLQCEPVEVSLVAVQRRVPTSTTEELTTWWRKQRRQRTWSTTRTFQCDQSSTDNPECGDNKSQVCTFCWRKIGLKERCLITWSNTWQPDVQLG